MSKPDDRAPLAPKGSSAQVDAFVEAARKRPRPDREIAAG